MRFSGARCASICWMVWYPDSEPERRRSHIGWPVRYPGGRTNLELYIQEFGCTCLHIFSHAFVGNDFEVLPAPFFLRVLHCRWSKQGFRNLLQFLVSGGYFIFKFTAEQFSTVLHFLDFVSFAFCFRGLLACVFSSRQVSSVGLQVFVFEALLCLKSELVCACRFPWMCFTRCLMFVRA